MSERIYSPKRILPYAALCLGLIACSGRSTNALPPPTPAPPTPTLAPTASVPVRGYDISWPQCGQEPELPNPASVADIGLSGTLANNFNPCFRQQMDQAKRLVLSEDNINVYVNVANPGPQPGVTDWPKPGKETPYGICDGSDTAACAYEYGKERAQADLDYLQQNVPGYSGRLLVDAETDYSWEGNTANNRAVVEGMVQEFKSRGHPVDIYSTSLQWGQIVGEVPQNSVLHGLPVWVAGAGSVDEAKGICQMPGFTGGEVAQVQIAGAGGQVDTDILCKPAV